MGVGHCFCCCTIIYALTGGATVVGHVESLYAEVVGGRRVWTPLFIPIWIMHGFIIGVWGIVRYPLDRDW